MNQTHLAVPLLFWAALMLLFVREASAQPLTTLDYKITGQVMEVSGIGVLKFG